MTERATDTSVTELLATAVAALGGSERRGQVAMAAAVAQAFDTDEHLVVQAGTGTGKSLAYLVPAIALSLRDESPVVVSTATIALQRQLVERDLPRLAESLATVLPRAPRFALLKGRRNYLCLNKIHGNPASADDDSGDGIEPQEELFDPVAATALGRDVQRLTAWASSTDTGDRDDLTPGVPERSWSQVSVSARECLGPARCPFGADCFSEKARGVAARADVVVTNHALLAIDAVSESAVLPEHALLVVDEAHELGDRVTSVATAELTSASLGAATRRVTRLVDPELRHRLEAATAAVIAGLSGITMVVGRIGGGFLLDRVNGNIVAALSTAFPVMASLLLLSMPGSVPAAVAAAAIVGLSLGAELDAVAYLTTRHFGLRSFGVLFGTIGGLQALATGSGPLLVNYVYDVTRSYNPALMLFIPICGLGAVLFLSLGRYPRFD